MAIGSQLHIDTLLEAGAVGRLLGLSPRRVRELVVEGKITPRYVTTRGTRLYDPGEILRLRLLAEEVAGS